ncbi:hypothetical protein CC1G_00071 [Coprinopsis cinerea okayama7|uniref:Uncharacterized protein n=1 Tax=Coprinopsis cinerea (strain Okayama-7 / 130 / ATCC MYA-4618 / FGSC 9003) TaxID=240176 RepID=A8NWM8_COPC7|nr:hypothetical protein CC1G_00071 [Coprinopsis cinerea okayama7\|eukprot:XP_001836935.2 hypothetical protein CC1G_00071 [Coprinopsis cinerea okayama7\
MVPVYLSGPCFGDATPESTPSQASPKPTLHPQNEDMLQGIDLLAPGVTEHVPSTDLRADVTRSDDLSRVISLLASDDADGPRILDFMGDYDDESIIEETASSSLNIGANFCLYDTGTDAPLICLSQEDQDQVQAYRTSPTPAVSNADSDGYAEANVNSNADANSRDNDLPRLFPDLAGIEMNTFSNEHRTEPDATANNSVKSVCAGNPSPAFNEGQGLIDCDALDGHNEDYGDVQDEARAVEENVDCEEGWVVAPSETMTVVFSQEIDDVIDPALVEETLQGPDAPEGEKQGSNENAATEIEEGFDGDGAATAVDAVGGFEGDLGIPSSPPTSSPPAVFTSSPDLSPVWPAGYSSSPPEDYDDDLDGFTLDGSPKPSTTARESFGRLLHVEHAHSDDDERMELESVVLLNSVDSNAEASGHEQGLEESLTVPDDREESGSDYRLDVVEHLKADVGLAFGDHVRESGAQGEFAESDSQGPGSCMADIQTDNLDTISPHGAAVKKANMSKENILPLPPNTESPYTHDAVMAIETPSGAGNRGEATLHSSFRHLATTSSVCSPVPSQQPIPGEVSPVDATMRLDQVPESKSASMEIVPEVQTILNVASKAPRGTNSPKTVSNEGNEDVHAAASRGDNPDRTYFPKPQAIPNPKRPTAAGQKLQEKKLSKPFRCPTISRSVDISRLPPPAPTTSVSSTQVSTPCGEQKHVLQPQRKSENEGIGANVDPKIKHRTVRASAQFKSPLTVRPSGEQLAIRPTPTIQALERKVQLLKRALRVVRENEEEVLKGLVHKWTEAGREIAWEVWDHVKDAATQGGDQDWHGAGHGKRKIQESWGWEDISESKKAKSNGDSSWGWDAVATEGQSGNDEDVHNSDDGDPRVEETGDEGEIRQDTIGTMLAQLGICPATLGWNEEEGCFV